MAKKTNEQYMQERLTEYLMNNTMFHIDMECWFIKVSGNSQSFMHINETMVMSVLTKSGNDIIDGLKDANAKDTLSAFWGLRSNRHFVKLALQETDLLWIVREKILNKSNDIFGNLIIKVDL